ncbi:hypothetical protein B0H16DRAFT_1548547 [Mycena metata]|uniref:Oxidoreductase AflY n=1 Tax=Mycena metata TaxID=1033252 RepID=A0AAD7N9X8_9AGAR|nr:hypothetical protein B0H16DRAFT_1548547 [Mycena metata]
MSSTAQDVAPPSPQPVRPGLVHGASTDAAAQMLGELLRKDYVNHHCFFNAKGFHNHLGHHLVAAYDLGAPPTLLKLIYEDEAPAQRPVTRDGEDITLANWTTRLGEEKAYGSYLVFFADEIAKNGVGQTLKKWLMAPEANGNGAYMLGRLLGGALHPFLQVGFGVEFGQDYMVAQGLALTAITSPEVSLIVLDTPSGLPEIHPPSTSKAELPTTQGASSSLLSLLHSVYSSPDLAPILPYDPNALLSARFRAVAASPTHPAALKAIYSQWPLDTTGSREHFAAKAEECIWQATLLLAATGKPNRSPRLDFFLMHLLTSAICLPRMLEVFEDGLHKAQLLQGYARVTALYVILRGRPRIDIPLLMSYSEFPHPPTQAQLPWGGADAVGEPGKEGETDPWPAILQNALHHKDAHEVKTIRSLYYGAKHYGQRPAGGAIGARDEEGKETHVGAGTMDGTIFVRAAGVVSDTLGWVAWGEKEGEWDRSALGWDAAWEDGRV